MERKKMVNILKSQKEELEEELKLQTKLIEIQNKKYLRKNAFIQDTKGLEKMIKFVEK